MDYWDDNFDENKNCASEDEIPGLTQAGRCAVRTQGETAAQGGDRGQQRRRQRRGPLGGVQAGVDRQVAEHLRSHGRQKGQLHTDHVKL